MTTIATDGRTVASDSRISAGGNTLGDKARKIIRSGREIIGCAGEGDSCEAYLKWMRGIIEDEPEMNWDGFSAIHVSKGGVYYVCGRNLSRHKVRVPFAIGSGKEFAIGAMLLGQVQRKL